VHPGARSVTGRITALLRVLGDDDRAGATTTELARGSGVPRPTAHRLLLALADEGYVDRDPRTGLWTLGPELYLLGTRAARHYDHSDTVLPVLRRLARQSGESTYFSARRGTETVCLLREDGDQPLRSGVLHVGARFPLGVVSAGLAVLAFLPEADINDHLAGVDLTAVWGASHSVSALRRRISRTRKDGYAVNPGLVAEGEWGIAAAVFDAAGRPAWALSMTGLQPRLSRSRRNELGTLVRREAHQLTKQLTVVVSG
jgi:DNA-binding IclR family transcriptional regulator